jgi:hypothetical protein
MLRRKCEELMSYVKVIETSLDNMDEKKNYFSKWGAQRSHKKKENELRKEMVKLE